MTIFEKCRRNRIERHYSVTCVSKQDGRFGQGYRFETLKEAEEAKSQIENVWGSELWDVVITKD